MLPNEAAAETLDDAAAGLDPAASPDAAGTQADGGSQEPPASGAATPQPGDAASTAVSETADAIAIAKLYGEPVTRLPTDLYIPPDALEIFLDAFEGPLDLLLYLIRKQNFNILDIPLAQVTLQYLEYVEQIRLHNLELAAEYLLMAAMLIEIKSRMLLPQRAPDLDAGEHDDPRAELVRKLLEYEQIKLAAQELNTLPQAERDFVKTRVHIEKSLVPLQPKVSLDELQQAFADILKRAKLTQHHTISREELSVREHMSMILRQLQSARFVEFAELFNLRASVPVVVVHFVAMLELAKETLIEITQAEPFAPIYVRLAYAPVSQE